MYIPHKTRKGLIYLVLIVFVGALIPAVVFGMNKYLEYRSSASPTIKPEEVRVTDLTDTSVTISWVTPSTESEGYVIYGTDDLSKYTRDLRDIEAGKLVKRDTHYVVLEGLKPDTTYKYKIVSGSKKFGNQNGNSFNFRTLSGDAMGLGGTPDPVYGTVLNGQDRSAVVYVNLEKGGKKSNVLSSLTNNEGGWEVDLSRVRSSSGESEFKYSKDTKMIVMAIGGNEGGASVIATVGSPTVDLDLTMSPDFDENNLLAKESQQDVDSGQEIDEQEGSSGDEVGSGGGFGGGSDYVDYTDSPESSDQSRFNTVDWTTLSQDINLSTGGTGEQVLGENVVIGEESIEVTNVRDTGFTVSWITTDRVTGSLEYGDTQEPDMWEESYDTRDTIASQDEYYVHHISIGDLDPEGVYYFRVNSGDNVYDNSGEFHSVELEASLDDPPSVPNPVVGEVSGEGLGDILVYVDVEDSAGEEVTKGRLSTVVQENGSWSISLQNAYDISGDFYYSPSDSDVVKVITKTMGDKDSAEILIADIEDEEVSTQIESYGGQSGGSDAESYTRQNALVSLDRMRSTPKTGFFLDILMGFGIAQVLIVLGVVIYPNSIYTRWERSIIKNIQDV